MKRSKEEQFQVWSVLAIIILITWRITVGIFYDNYKSKENNFLETELQRFESEVNSTLITYEEFENLYL